MPKIIAINAVERIIYDLTDRAGLGNQFESCDEEIQEEIKEKWANIIAEEIKKSQEVKIDREKEIEALKIWKEQRIGQAIAAITEVFDEEIDKLNN